MPLLAAKALFFGKIFTMQKSALLISILALWSLAGMAGNKYDYQIRFKGGVVESSPNTEMFIEDPGIQPEEWVGDRYYRLVQFSNLPTAQEKEVLTAGGITLQGYVPNYTYIASIHKDADLSLLSQLDVRGVYRYDGALKIHPALLKAEFPDWILRGGNNILIAFNYHEDIASEDVVSAIIPYVQDIEVVSEYGQYVTAVIDVNNLQGIAALPHLVFVEPGPEEGQPEDFNGRSMHRSYSLDAEYGAGRQYDGEGVVVAVNDDGNVGPHVDFKGRIDQNEVIGNNGGTHGDGVAGIIGGAGNIDPYYVGMAPGSDLYIRQYQSSLPNTVTLHNNNGIMIFNSSYSNGCNAGYTSVTRQVDQEIRQNPALIQVFSAGNSGNSDCGYVTAGDSWGNITGGHKIAKNVIATANLYYDELIASSSSRGPAADGRLKPDIAAHGQGQGSTDENDTYMGFGGTSAASPGIAGICAQMYDAYRDLNGGNDPESSLIKALLLNTAEDMGNPGPDFEFGWGRVNARRAVELLENNQYLSSTISTGDTNTHTITVPANTKELRVMLYWADYEATTSAAKDLVNDLDFQVEQPNNSILLPWILDPSPTLAALTTPAWRGVDDLNNVEQVTIENPAAGSYDLHVLGSVVPQGPQKYYVIYEFVGEEIVVAYPQGGEGFAPGESIAIRWDAVDRSGGPFTLRYSSNNGSTWTTFATNVNDTARSYDWGIPSTAPVSGQYLIQVSRGGVNGVSVENFSVIRIPTNIQITTVCPSYTEISWNAVANATSYDVYILGQKYMDSVGTTTNTNFQIPGTNQTVTDWISVSANGPNDADGRRAVAVQKQPGVVNCVIASDIDMNTLSSPASTYSDCFNTSNLPVTVKIDNDGQNPVSNLSVAYQINNNAVVRETVAGPIAAGGSTTFTFNADVSFPSTAVYDFKVWAELPGDQNPYNDTINSPVSVYASSLISLPWSEDFEGFLLCNTASDCEAGVCAVSAGWRNNTNGVEDDIDFRTDNNGTATNNSGPTTDYNPGTTQGRYMYTEASFGQTGCANKTAELLTPCIDLTTASNPIFTFRYHMFGQTMGDLVIDVFDGTSWTNDLTTISGDQGDVWNLETLNLNQFAGDKIVIRFRGTTGNGFSSDIAIDDINMVDNSPPTAIFTISETEACVNDILTATDGSTGSSLTYAWSFGSGSLPASSTSQGPHNFYFTFPGTKSVTLQVSNQAGTDFETKTVQISDVPASFFTFNQTDNVITFNNSSSGANSTYWDFGDGTNSTQLNPVKTYTAIGTYTVSLISDNGCGSDTTRRTVNVDKVTGITDIDGFEFSIYPNPASTVATLDFGTQVNGDLEVYVYDASGRVVKSYLLSDEASVQIELDGLASGIYQVEVLKDGEGVTLPLNVK